MLRNGWGTIAAVSVSCALVLLSAPLASAAPAVRHELGNAAHQPAPVYPDDPDSGAVPSDGSSAQNEGTAPAGVSDPGYATAPTGPTPPATRLTITISGSPVPGHDGKFVLTCDPPGGQHPDPKNACAKLEQAAAAHQDLFAAVPEGQMCTQMFGGPATAQVVGTWRDRTINAKLSRTDGCQTDRWNKLVPVIPPEAPAGR